jgi:ribonuclease E
MITIDVNSGKASHKRNVEETAFKTNLDAAEEIARQLRLRDLGGLIVIDFIDMMDRKNVAEVEKAFKKAMSVDRSRVQLAHISKFGILELSRQKKQSTIQEISYTACPHCRGTGTRPSLEYAALGALRKITTQAVKGTFSAFRVTLPAPVADYLLNHKRNELAGLESTYDMSIHICGSPDMTWDEIRIETTVKETPAEPPEPEAHPVVEGGVEAETEDEAPPAAEAERAAKKPEERPEERAAQQPEGPAKKGRRRSRHRRRRSGAKKVEQKAPEEAEHATAAVVTVEAAALPALPPSSGLPAATPPSAEPTKPAPAEKGPRGDRSDLLKLLQQAFESED